MDLTGRLVHFWLSPSGREALEDVIAGGPDFEALVVEEDDVGLWIWMPDPEHGFARSDATKVGILWSRAVGIRTGSATGKVTGGLSTARLSKESWS
jgi:hypothetical protein